MFWGQLWGPHLAVPQHPPQQTDVLRCCPQRVRLAGPAVPRHQRHQGPQLGEATVEIPDLQDTGTRGVPVRNGETPKGHQSETPKGRPPGYTKSPELDQDSPRIRLGSLKIKLGPPQGLNWVLPGLNQTHPQSKLGFPPRIKPTPPGSNCSPRIKVGPSQKSNWGL